MSKYKTLEHKYALVTGASGGVGEAISVALAAQGCNLFLTGRSNIKLSDLAASMALKNIEVSYAAADLESLEGIFHLMNSVKQSCGKIDILVNSAGWFPVKLLSDSTVDDYEKCFNMNVRAPFLLAKTFSQEMVQRRWGRIVNIGSSSAYSGFKETALYCSSKHALLGLSRSLHDELKEHNVRTFCVSPGSIKTEMGKLVRNQDFESFIEPKDVAEIVCFIISFEGNMITDELRLNRMIIK